MASNRLTETIEIPTPSSEAGTHNGGRGFGVQTVYEALQRDIIEMTLAPGEPLDETRLSRRFAMSRTPVREAMVRLAAEGLVTTLPNRNTIVTPIDFSSVPVYFDALVLMYRVTTRLAAMHRKESDLIEIRALGDAFARTVEEADAFGMIAVNRDFHIAIARAGRNRYFTELFAKLLDEGRRLLRLYYSSYDDHLPKHFVDEHDEIIAARGRSRRRPRRPHRRRSRRPGGAPDPEFPRRGRRRPRRRPRRDTGGAFGREAAMTLDRETIDSPPCRARRGASAGPGSMRRPSFPARISST